MAYLNPVVASEKRLKISRSAYAILDLLNEKKNPLAVKEIKEELPYSERTIHYALRQLKNHSLIEKKLTLNDLRESRYLLGLKATLYGYSPYR